MSENLINFDQLFADLDAPAPHLELVNAVEELKGEQTFWNTPERITLTWLTYLAITHLLKERGMGRIKRHVLALVINDARAFAMHPAEYKALYRSQRRFIAALVGVAKENLG